MMSQLFKNKNYNALQYFLRCFEEQKRSLKICFCCQYKQCLIYVYSITISSFVETYFKNFWFIGYSRGGQTFFLNRQFYSSPVYIRHTNERLQNFIGKPS